jgi:hypothetical protein
MHKTISVFFSGTSFSIEDSSFLAGSLYRRTEENQQQIKMGFDGCGVLYPVLGTILGNGLDEQADQVIQRIAQEIGAGNELTLNVYGHSRGAIGALMLAQQLSLVDPNKLSINMALLDPVPGNLITTSTLDLFNITLANKAMDLRGCKPLKKVLALYPHMPLPDLAFHAPLFVSYPEGIEVKESVIAGCHAAAENMYDSASTIASLRVEEFFAKNGTQFSSSIDYTDSDLLRKSYLAQYEIELMRLNSNGQPMTRSAHSAKGVYINTKLGAQYFNEHHKRLAGGAEDATVALTIEQNRGPISFLKRTITAHPLAWQILKWSSLSLSLAGLLFLTGGLGAIPLIATVVAKLGVFSIFVAAPVAGGALATLWYGAIKPALSWCINRIFYPMYSIRNIIASPLEVRKDSTALVLDILSDGQSPKILNLDQQLFNIRITQRVGQVPSDQHQNNTLLKMSPLETNHRFLDTTHYKSL